MVRSVMRRLCHAAVIFAAMLSTTPPAAGQMEFAPGDSVSGVAEAEEGDILSIGGRTLRLYGIDAPELGQICRDRRGRSYDCGAAARNVLTRFLTGRALDCEVYANTIDGLETGRCFAGATDIGGLMVQSGWAFSYRAFSHRYASAEARAQAGRRGFWEGRVQRPWVWRTEQIREAAGG